MHRSGRTALPWLRRRTLLPLVRLIETEAVLLAAANPDWQWAPALRQGRPADLGYRFVWQGFPHVDPSKESAATEQQMRNGTLPYSDACLAEGRDPDEVIAQRASDDMKLRAAGLPTVTAAMGAGAAEPPAADTPAPEPDDLDDEEDDEE